MSTQVMPCVASVGTSASTITVAGSPSHVCLVNQTASTVVYARPDAAPLVEGDECWPVFPTPAEGQCVPTLVSAAGQGTASVQVIVASGTAKVSVLPCCCED